MEMQDTIAPAQGRATARPRSKVGGLLAGMGALVMALSVTLAAPAGALPSAASQPKTAAGAVAAAKAISSCPSCSFKSTGSAASVHAGLTAVTVSDPGGAGGYVMIMGYTGKRWGLLQAGQDSPYVSSLPAKMLICQSPGNATNVRSGPGTKYKVVARVKAPKTVTANRFQLKRSGSDTGQSGDEGEGWYRVKVSGRTGWVASYLTYPKGAGGCASWLMWPWPDGTSKK